MNSNRLLEAPITLPTKEMKTEADNLVQKINDHEEIISRGIAKLHQKEEKSPNSEEISEIQNLLLDRYKMLLETHIQLIRLESKYIDSEKANVNRKWKATCEAANKEKNRSSLL